MKTLEQTNRLIAEFMNLGNGFPNYFIPKHEEPREDKMHSPHFYMESYFLPSELKYHTSWDWLMPVIEKIESDIFDGEITFIIDGDSAIVHNMNRTFDLFVNLHSKLDSTYNAVVATIEWYNENQNK